MNEIETQQVSVKDLRIGMYVVELDRPWLGTPFLFQGFPITRQEEIDLLRRYCAHVYIDVVQTRNWSPERRAPSRQEYMTTLSENKPPQTAKTPWYRFSTRRLNVEDEGHDGADGDGKGLLAAVRQARQVHHKAHDYMLHVLDDVRLGKSIDPAGAKELVSGMVDSIVTNENALMWLAQLKNRDEYTSLHSINVCIISLAFGRFLGFTVTQLNELGQGALLHDIGKMRVPLNMLNKPGRLTAPEMDELRRHPEYGYELLKGKGGISPRALEVVRSHHERMDGGGYPRGLRGGQISEYAMLVSIVDVYDAITSDRAYHQGISPHEALKLMYEWAPRSFPRELLQSFINCLGIYPVGSIVELSSGEVGVVMTVNRRLRLRPLVLLVLDGEKQPYPVRKLINLELYAEGEGQLSIKRILESGAYGIDVRAIAMDEQAHLQAEEQATGTG